MDSDAASSSVGSWSECDTDSEPEDLQSYTATSYTAVSNTETGSDSESDSELEEDADTEADTHVEATARVLE
ncbi:hypothetical protein LTR16_006310, partial [Cryomyces antarcticus]